jgi:hypothetical protein
VFRISELEVKLSHMMEKAAEARSTQDIVQGHFATLASSIASMQESQALAKGQQFTRSG